jgi:hypothetical protein
MMDEGDEFALLYRRSDVAPNDYFPKEADKNSVGPKRSERLPRRIKTDVIPMQHLAFKTLRRLEPSVHK